MHTQLKCEILKRSVKPRNRYNNNNNNNIKLAFNIIWSYDVYWSHQNLILVEGMRGWEYSIS